MAFSKPLVSVIIPVYNVEHYIEQCVRSVIEQEYDNKEIILVNDGSTDGTIEVVRRCFHDYPHITIIEQENQGAAWARKNGLDIAKGKYVQYLDGDDTLLPDALADLVECAEKSQADIVVASFYFCRPQAEKERSVYLAFDEMNGISYFGEILDGRGYWCLWSHLQKRTLFYDYGVEIVSGINFGEDAIWMTQLLFHDPKIVALNKTTVNYNINPYSISYRQEIACKRHNDYRAYQLWIEDYVQKYGYWNRFEEKFAILHIETAQVSIRRKRFERTFSDVRRVVCAIDKYPQLSEKLYGRLFKLVRLYKKSPVLSFLKLKYYVIKGMLLLI